MRPEPVSRTTSLLQIVALAVSVAAALLLAWHPLEDLDIWFHDRAGADLLAQGPLPSVNHYSFTEPGHPWLNHEWLFQFLVHATSPGRGPAPGNPDAWNGLRITLACALALLLVLGDGGWRRLRGQGSALAAVGSGAVLLAAFALLWPRLLLRPELISYLALVLLVRWTEALRAGISRDGPDAVHLRALVDPRTAAGRITWLVWVWAQTHGFSAAAPLIVVFGLLAGPARDPVRRPGRIVLRAAGLAGLATLLALLLTPNGWQGLVFPLRAIGQFRGSEADLRRTVAELTPLLSTPNALPATILFFKLSLAAGAVTAVLGWRRIGALRVMLWLAMGVAALASQRALGPYAVAFALMALRAGWPERWRPKRPVAAATVRMAAGGAAGVLIGVAGWWLSNVASDRFYLAEGVARRFGGGLATAQYPVAAGIRLATEAPARVFANLGASGYLLGNTGSEVYIDGRTEAYSSALWREYLEIRQGGDHALALLDARQVEAACLASPAGPFSSLAEALLASHRWRLDAADGGGLLLRRVSLPPGPEGAPRLENEKRDLLQRAAMAERDAAAAGGMSSARSADGLLAAAALHRLAGDESGRRTCLEQAVARAPGHALAHHNLGNVLMADGRFEEAYGHFRTASHINGRLAGSRLNAGVSLMRLKRAAESATWFEQVTRLDAASVEGWANLAIARQATGNRAGALAAVERALQLSPGNARLAGLREALRRGGTDQ